MWDVATGTNVQTLNHNKAVHAVGMAAGGDGVVAFGGAEGTLRIWDPRTRTGEKLVGVHSPASLPRLRFHQRLKGNESF